MSVAYINNPNKNDPSLFEINQIQNYEYEFDPEVFQINPGDEHIFKINNCGKFSIVVENNSSTTVYASVIIDEGVPVLIIGKLEEMSGRFFGLSNENQTIKITDSFFNW